MRINQNISAMNTYSRLTNANTAKSNSLAKLSSGLRINKAGDDAAGLAISEKMRGQIGGLKQAVRNSQDGISLIQTAEGALSETHSILQRMRELVVQSNNDTNSPEDRVAIQDELTELIYEVDGISQRTEFNGKNLLQGKLGLKLDSVTASSAEANLVNNGAKIDVSQAAAGKTFTFAYSNDATSISLSDGETTQSLTLGANGAFNSGQVLNFDKLGVKIAMGGAGAFGTDGSEIVIDTLTLVTEDDPDIAGKATLQIGANSNQKLDLSIGNMSASSLGASATASFALDGVNVTSQSFDDNLSVIDQAINDVSAQRSKLGATQNRLDHTINNLTATAENLSAAESRIRDVDMAEEMMEFTKNNILSQAATSMLAQANQMPQSVLQLLQ